MGRFERGLAKVTAEPPTITSDDLYALRAARGCLSPDWTPPPLELDELALMDAEWQAAQ